MIIEGKVGKDMRINLPKKHIGKEYKIYIFDKGHEKKLYKKYKIAKEKLLENAYDDNHGITLAKKDYERRIKQLEKKLAKIKGHKKKYIKDEIIRLKKDLEEFVPQWFEYDKVIDFVKASEEYIAIYRDDLEKN